MPIHLSHRGRGTVESPPNRFERLSIESDDGAWEEIAKVDPDFEPRRLRTEFLRDDTKSLITANDSPDIGFTHSLNPYRGCEHGCAYCYARPYHEYLGYNAGIDFETRLLVKERAPELLEAELAMKSWVPTSLACSGVTDCYQPIERKLEITRRCLAVLADFRQPVGLITKNALVTRDLDHLRDLAQHGAVNVVLSLTTLDAQLASVLEPRASRPSARLEALKTLSDAGIPGRGLGRADHSRAERSRDPRPDGGRGGARSNLRLGHGAAPATLSEGRFFGLARPLRTREEDAHSRAGRGTPRRQAERCEFRKPHAGHRSSRGSDRPPP
jgi:hypothetical protein